MTPGRRIFWAVLLAAWLGALWTVSHWHGKSGGWDYFPHEDKVKHFVFYAVGAWLCGAVLPLKWRPWGRTAAIVGFAALTGAWDEWNQSFMPGRYGLDVWDWLADLAGGGVAARWWFSRSGAAPGR